MTWETVKSCRRREGQTGILNPDYGGFADSGNGLSSNDQGCCSPAHRRGGMLMPIGLPAGQAK